VKFVPLIVTLVSTGPACGRKARDRRWLETVTVKLPVLLAVPPAVVTLIGPVVAPAGTLAVIAVAEFTVKLALTALNVTAVAPLKFVPLIVTLVPTGPLLGAKLAIVGAFESGSTPNTSSSVVVPTYTLPLTTVGTVNLTAGPSVSRPPAAWLLL